MVERSAKITEADVFLLHQAIQTTAVVDVYKPIGNWKVESNGTYIVDGEKRTFYEYAAPNDVPGLMKKWIDLLNEKIRSAQSRDEAVTAYADLHASFVWIHPFFDGNGRMARLLANLPVLKAAFPPIVISKPSKREYILSLSRYSLQVERPNGTSTMHIENDRLNLFRTFCKESWQQTIYLIDAAKEKQAGRDQKDGMKA